MGNLWFGLGFWGLDPDAGGWWIVDGGWWMVGFFVFFGGRWVGREGREVVGKGILLSSEIMVMFDHDYELDT